MATALGYKVDATKATAHKDATASCANCNLYSGKAGAADDPCTLFQGNLVSAKGWCTAWAKKLLRGRAEPRAVAAGAAVSGRRRFQFLTESICADA